jgi:uncharacterized protein involved in outer membrane biogenesis
VLLIVLAVAFVLLLDTMAKAVAEHEIRRSTGLEVTIGRLEVGLLNSKFRLENLIIYNAPEFGGAPMINLPELHLEYRLRDLLAGRMHLELLRLNLTELHLVEGRDGRMNLAVLTAHLGAEAERKARKNGPPTARDFGGIDTLNLTLGRLRFSSLKNPETKGYYNLGIENWILTGIKKEEEIPAALQAMAKRKGLEALWNRIYSSTAATNNSPRPAAR